MSSEQANWEAYQEGIQTFEFRLRIAKHGKRNNFYKLEYDGYISIACRRKSMQVRRQIWLTDKITDILGRDAIAHIRAVDISYNGDVEYTTINLLWTVVFEDYYYICTLDHVPSQ